MKSVRSGELIALAGTICVILALTQPWYQTPSGNIDAWATFGPAVALLMLGALAGLWLALANLTERSAALPVAAAVWGTLIGFIAVIAAIVRVLERPEHASGLCVGSWLGLAGALAIFAGCWQSMRDERTGIYPPDATPPRPAPPRGAG
jgi:hypothetical protein